MSEETLHKQKFQVDQWPTSKVTLYPTRASIVRQIEGVKLKSGLNEITISDLTSLADPDSVRVAGTTDNHPARINDLTIDLVPNKYSFLSDLSDSDSESDDDEDEEPPSLIAAKEALDKITVKIKEVDERRSSAQKELSFVEKYASTVASSTSSTTIPDPKTMKDTLDLYNKQRAALFDTITAFERDLVELAKERVKKGKVVDKEKQAFGKAIRAKVEARKKKKADKDETKREKNETKPEKSSTVHRVRITIELPLSDLTAQASSTETEEVFQDATLTLTYTTTSASWTPHYDLRLDTTNPSLSSLTYRAHFINRTYETWSQAAITLSTSQASFGGLKEKIPQMEGWRVTLAKKWNTINTANGENGLYSLAELNAKKEAEQKQYGIDILSRERVQLQGPSVKMKKGGGMPQWGNVQSFGVGGPPPPAIPAPSASSTRSRYRSSSPARSARRQVDEDDNEEYMGSGLHDNADGATLAPVAKAMEHAPAGSDTYGFTTTYELPTARTIPSSPLVRRHVIAEIPLPSLMFTHIVIPKLKAAAFLKAKVTNTSNVPLLPGQAGMTLDGSFMGNLAFPRCSPSETVVLELGVDQAVKVEYERPTVKHGTQGMILMGKEEVGMFKRTMRITNSKSSIVSLVVLDQIPVPEDERLKVNITTPRGLKDVDDVVKNGVGVDGKAHGKGPKKQIAAAATSPKKLDDISETGSIKNKSFNFNRRDSTLASGSKPSESSTPIPAPAATLPEAKSGSGWGTAKAGLKKNGEIRWDVDLNKGGCVALALEWECRMPGGEGVQALS